MYYHFFASLLLVSQCFSRLVSSQSRDELSQNATPGRPDSGRAPFPLVVRQYNETSVGKPSRLANATSSDVEKARAIVQEAIKKAASYSEARIRNPLRNNYKLGPNPDPASAQENGIPPPVQLTDEITA